MYVRLRVKYPLFLSDGNETWTFSTYLRKILKFRFRECPSSGSRVVPYRRIYRQTDRHGEDAWKLLTEDRIDSRSEAASKGNAWCFGSNEYSCLQIPGVEKSFTPHVYLSRCWPCLILRTRTDPVPKTVIYFWHWTIRYSNQNVT